MGITKLLPIQGWVFLGILAGGTYFGYTTYTSFAEKQRIPGLETIMTGPRVAADDLAEARAMLSDPSDLQLVDRLAQAIASAKASDLPALKAQAAAVRLNAQTDCILFVGKTSGGELEILSRNGGMIRPAVRCASINRSGELVTVQGLAPTPPWISTDDASNLPLVKGRSWVEIGRKPSGRLAPVWNVPVAQ